MRHVALRGFDQIGDEIVPPLELHIDLRKLVLVIVAERDEPVIDADAEHQDDRDDRHHNSKYEQHAKQKRSHRYGCVELKHQLQFRGLGVKSKSDRQDHEGNGSPGKDGTSLFEARHGGDAGVIGSDDDAGDFVAQKISHQLL